MYANGKTRKATRLIWEMLNGPVPEQLWVLHTCDIKPCCNPRHLYLGTAKQNTRDALERGQYPLGDRHGSRLHPDRRPYGERHPFYGDSAWATRAGAALREQPQRRARGTRHGNAKLDEVRVAEIRARAAAGQSQLRIAREMVIARATVGAVVRREYWTHVA